MEEKNEITPDYVKEQQINTEKKSMYSYLVDDFANGILHLATYGGVGRFKSIRRAIKRGHVSIQGMIYPKRPFKNVKSLKGSINYMKKRLYEQYTHRNKKLS